MARDPDAQLLEAVAVRRRRLRTALLHGRGRTTGVGVARRLGPEGVARLLAGGVLAAVLCAGCVGYAFLMSALERQERERNATRTPDVPVVTQSPSATPTSRAPR